MPTKEQIVAYYDSGRRYWTCSVCDQRKPIDQFPTNKNYTLGFSYTCRECKRSSWKDRSAVYRVNAAERNKLRRQQLHIFMMMSGGCLNCGELEPVCLVWHHVKPELKTNSISSLMGGNELNLILELAKCCILCCNCHAKVHGGILTLPPNCEVGIPKHVTTIEELNGSY